MPNTPHSLGDLQSLTDDSMHVLATAQRGSIEIAPLACGAVRVRVSRRKKPGAYRSLALAEPGPSVAPYKLESLGDQVQLVAGDVTAVIRVNPLALHFTRRDGSVIAADVEISAANDRMVLRKAVRPDSRIYGLGEKTGWLDKRHRRYRMRNTDVFVEFPAGIGAATDPLYATFPFFIVHEPGENPASPVRSYGVFVDATEFTEFDLTQDDWYEVTVPADTVTYYVLTGPALPDVLRQYTDLTGRMPMPALWTLGYHQCRWSYGSDDQVRQVAQGLREHGIPADCIWLDIDYMNGYRVFTWNKDSFPNPAQLTSELAQQGLRAVTIVDPGVKVDPQYFMYQEGQRDGHFIRHPDGREYHGNVWPGESAFPDFHAPAARAWWGGHVAQWLAETGLSGIWNDMNEPACTDITGPVNEVLHAGGRILHPSARNTYGLQMARATYDAMLQRDPDARPFILTRAAYSGAQTVTAQWLGDNSSAWEHLAASLPMLMNMGLSGMPFVGVDIGGFMGDTDGELLARWAQAGAFYPFCRNHSAIGTRAQEPWAFGPRVEAIYRRCIELRYQLLPYLYNVFYQAAQTGAPIMRPLAWHYPDDPKALNLNDQFLVGSDVLVAPVLAPGLAARSVYLPKGAWYRCQSPISNPQSLFSNPQSPVSGPAHIVAEAPLEELPLFVRGGAIIPAWPLAQHTGAVDRADTRLHVWPGDGQLDYYEDDGLTRAYTRGEEGWRITPFQVRAARSGWSVKWGPPRGAYEAGRAKWTLVLHGAGRARVALDGRPVRARRDGDGDGDAAVVQVLDDGKKHAVTVT